MIVLDAPWSLGAYVQILGRAVRLNSHNHISEAENGEDSRIVLVHRLCFLPRNTAVTPGIKIPKQLKAHAANKKIPEAELFAKKLAFLKSSDLHIYKLLDKKWKQWQGVRTQLLDCSIEGTYNVWCEDAQQPENIQPHKPEPTSKIPICGKGRRAKRDYGRNEHQLRRGITYTKEQQNLMDYKAQKDKTTKVMGEKAAESSGMLMSNNEYNDILQHNTLPVPEENRKELIAKITEILHTYQKE
jgi:hypothetical protein